MERQSAAAGVPVSATPEEKPLFMPTRTERIPLELERLEAAYTGIRAAKLDGMPRSGSGTREAAILSNIARRDEALRRFTMALYGAVESL